MNKTPSAMEVPALAERMLPGTVLGILLICSANILKNVDRVLLGVLAPALKVDFRLTDSQIGMLSMAFAVAYAVCGAPLGRAADRMPRRRVIAAVTAIWSLATAACGAATSYMGLFFGRMGVAIGEAGLLPAGYSLVSDFLPARLRNVGLGVLNASSSVGVTLGLMLGGWLAHFGWRTAFFALGLPGLVVALIVLLFLPEPERGSSDVVKPPPQSAKFGVDLMALLKNPLYVWLVVGAAFNTFAAVGMVQWLPSFFTRVHHMPVGQVGLFFGITFGLGMLLGQLAGAALAAKVGRRGVFEPMTIAIWANLLLTPAFLVSLWVGDVTVALAFTLAAAFLGSLAHPVNSAGTQNAVMAGQRGLSQGLVGLLVALVGMGLGPLVTGVLSDIFHKAGYENPLRYAMSCATAVFLIAAFASWRALRLGRRRFPPTRPI